MIQGLYSAANGMMAVEDRQAVIANNIANATTPGFKRQLAVQKGFYQELVGTGAHPQLFNSEKAPGGGLKVNETFTNYANGIVTETGNPLDLALIGPGFFEVDTPDGVRLTRSGRFSVGENGFIVTGNGNRLLGVSGEPIDVSGGMVQIDEAGNVYVNDEIRDQLSILEFDDPHALSREGYTLFRAADAVLASSRQAESTIIAPQSIEGSNVQLPVEMVNMMMALRAYAANQQVLQSVSETTGKLIDQVGGQG
ncbi:MAG: flagellar basal-body rod protein FlgF [Candidatus Hydrogenedentota bacterium]|nr:MAG: flagellar basal-body rod protein FlgF [Candidatus Hydrogenedentota bacterium]